ncbi:TonB-dependent receptor [Pseudoxanthomonas yeongjuensis]|uniref:TonB-dependent receptor n=1 Tax=Pseudoxanthomonas yeongjuensis TaxID=377616 RepID=UPI001391CCDA|nr:TonB-dependent receptor [Pseudoxanthomonas yeongjuensis]
MNVSVLRKRKRANQAAICRISESRHKAIAIALVIVLVGVGAIVTTSPALAQQSAAQGKRYSIPASSLREALDTLASQGDLSIVYAPELVAGKTTLGLSGHFASIEALRRLLEGSGLTWESINATTVVLKRASDPSPKRAPAAKSANSSQKQQNPDEVTTLPEVLVRGERGFSLNADIPRTRDDVLPYVVFDRERIEQSGAANIDDFLKQRLTMNTQQGSFSQGVDFGNRSRVNLRGLGANQTLILIDGRRTSNSDLGGTLLQQDLNGIPLDAVERIEILPATAGGIYGGDATGGVVNVILRRDYQGFELRVGYDSSFSASDAKRKLDLRAGFNLDGGKTKVLIAGTLSDAEPLLLEDRRFVRRYRDEAFANRPDLWLPPTAPPLGATTNICSATVYFPGYAECNATPLVLDDGTSLNSPITHVPNGYPGMGAGTGALVANAGSYNFDLANSSQTGGGRTALLNNPTLESLNLTVHREFGPRVRAFLEGMASNNIGHFTSSFVSSAYSLAADAPNNPFQQPIQISVPLPMQDSQWRVETTDRRLVAGLIAELPKDWRAEMDYIFSRTRNTQTINGAIRSSAQDLIFPALENDPAFNPIRDTNLYPIDLSPYMTTMYEGPFETTTKDVTLLLGGPIGSLPAGRPTLSVRLEHRDESFDGGTSKDLADDFGIEYPGKSQSVISMYGEVRVPLVSAKNRLKFTEELELQLSIRRDDYTVHGAPNYRINFPGIEQPASVDSKLHSINPTVGFRWQPIEDVAFRASYGTGFLPPNVTQLVPEAFRGTIPSTLLDPRRGNLPINVDIPNAVLYGGNPHLQPEESKTRSMGLILTPRFLPALRLSLDYIRIQKEGNIANHPQDIQGLVNDEQFFPGRIVRGPKLPGDPEGWAGPIAFIDQTLLNIALAEVGAYDMQLDYRFETDRAGTFDFAALVTWQPHLQTQTKAGQPIVDNVGFRGGVLEYKANAGLVWNRRGWTVGWNSRYFDSYKIYGPTSSATTIANNIVTQGTWHVPSQVYHDAFATYRFGGAGSASLGEKLFKGSEITFGIRNVFNKQPPRDLQSYSTYGDPRLASYYLSFKKSF